MIEVTSRLRGWDYVYSLMYTCPECGEKPFLGNTIDLKKWRCGCMNNCCHNMHYTEHKNPFMAIHEWNMKYGKKEREENA